MVEERGLLHSVYIDLDDVLGETLRTFSIVLKQTFDIDVKFEDIYSFNLDKSFGLNQKQYAEFMKIVHEPTVLLSITPMIGAIDVLNEWESRGIFIAVITGRPISTLETSKTWLIENKIPFDSISVVDKYGRDKGNTLYKPFGIRTIAKSNFVLAVEDSPKMARFVAKNNKIPVALLDRPWNKKMSKLTNDLQALIIRCQNWQDIGCKFKGLIDGIT